MPKRSYREIFLEAKNYYFSLVFIVCPLLKSEEIFFTRKGFEHIIRKGRKLRPISDQIRRFRLLRYVPEVLRSATRIVHTEGTRLQFWTLHYFTEGKSLRLVVCQEGNGKKQFLSIMD